MEKKTNQAVMPGSTYCARTFPSMSTNSDSNNQMKVKKVKKFQRFTSFITKIVIVIFMA